MKTKQQTAEEWVKLLVEENGISNKDDPLSILIIIGALINGADKNKIKEWLSKYYNKSKFETMWNRAIKQRIFVNGKIAVEDVEEGFTTVELFLNACILEGFIERA